MLDFIPLHLSAIERTLELEPWLRLWLGKDVEFLDAAGWFSRGHDHQGGEFDGQGFWRHKIKSATFVWSPPPAATDVALEELRKARMKQQESTHVFLVPRLLTP